MMHPYIHTSPHPCIHAYTHAFTHPSIHASIHPYIHVHMHSGIHASIHTHTKHNVASIYIAKEQQAKFEKQPLFTKKENDRHSQSTKWFYPSLCSSCFSVFLCFFVFLSKLLFFLFVVFGFCCRFYFCCCSFVVCFFVVFYWPVFSVCLLLCPCSLLIYRFFCCNHFEQ